MKTLTNMKRGDTFAFIATLTDQLGIAIIGVASNLRAEVRTGNNSKISECVITETEVPGSYLFQISDTSHWPISLLYTDIQYTAGDIVSSSETMSISVEKDITI